MKTDAERAALKRVSVEAPATIKLQIWDIGADMLSYMVRFGKSRTASYRGSHAFILAYDISNRSSFNDLKSKHWPALQHYFSESDAANGLKTPESVTASATAEKPAKCGERREKLLVLGCKSDLRVFGPPRPTASGDKTQSDSTSSTVTSAEGEEFARSIAAAYDEVSIHPVRSGGSSHSNRSTIGDVIHALAKRCFDHQFGLDRLAVPPPPPPLSTAPFCSIM